MDVELFGALAPLIAGENPPGKGDLVRTPRKALPREVRARPKTGFAIPVRDWVSGRTSDTPERGLRGWARQVYRAAQA